jgi:hypothetical protein
MIIFSSSSVSAQSNDKKSDRRRKEMGNKMIPFYPMGFCKQKTVVE